ncbi:MAG: glycosyltransferase family 9 protein [Candidatus Coatesbacteria bacterium]|nr:glycosyltransferase family 9 protein [Candidatus Coatesbacteria bacterium]
MHLLDIRKFVERIFASCYLKFNPLIEISKPEKIESILLIRLDHLGDLILTTPLIEGIKEVFPESRLHVLSWAYCASIIDSNEFIDRIHVVKDRNLRTLSKYFKENLNKEDFNLVICPSYDFLLPDAFLASLFKNSYKIAFKTEQGKGFFHEMVERQYDVYEADHNLRILASWKPNISSKPLRINPGKEKIREADMIFGKLGIGRNKVVGIHPGARRPHHIWQIDKIVRLIKNIEKLDNSKVLVTHGSHDRSVVSVIKKSIPGIIVAPETDVQLLAAIIQKCSFFITEDTAPMHITVAVNTPSLTLWGDGDLKRWGLPSSKLHSYVYGKKIRDFSFDEVWSMLEPLLVKYLK